MLPFKHYGSCLSLNLFVWSHQSKLTPEIHYWMSVCHNDNDLAAATGHDCTTDSPWRFTGTNIKYNLDLIETIDLVETIQYDIQHLLQTVRGQWGNHFRWFYLSSDLEKGPIFFIKNCLLFHDSLISYLSWMRMVLSRHWLECWFQVGRAWMKNEIN